MPENKDKQKEPQRKPVGFHPTDNEMYELGFDGIHTYFVCHSFNDGDWKKIRDSN